MLAREASSSVICIAASPSRKPAVERGEGGEVKQGLVKEKENSETLLGNMPEDSLCGDQKRCSMSFRTVLVI